MTAKNVTDKQGDGKAIVRWTKKGTLNIRYPTLFMMHCVRTPISISAHSLMEL